MFKRSSTAKEGDGDPSRLRSRGPKLSTKLSDLGDRMRRIRTSPSQPNLGSHSGGSSTSIPPVPPLRLPLTPTSPSKPTLPPTSPRQHLLSPASTFTSDGPVGSETGTPPSTSQQPRILLQAKSLDTMSSSKNSGRLGDELVSTPDASPITPERKKPTTRKDVLARKRSEAEAATLAAMEIRSADHRHPSNAVSSSAFDASSIVISPPTESTLSPSEQDSKDHSVRDLTQATPLDPSSSRSQSTISTPTVTSALPITPISPNDLQPVPSRNELNSDENHGGAAPAPALFPRNYTLSTASATSFMSTASASSDPSQPTATSRPHPTHSTSSFATSSESFRRFDTVPDTPPVPPIPEKYRYQPIRAIPIASVDSNNPTSIAPPGNGNNSAMTTMTTVDLSIAVIGAAGCGKSELIWKGMKVWGLGPTITPETCRGIDVFKRVARPSVSTSASSPSKMTRASPSRAAHSALERIMDRERSSTSTNDDDDASSTLHERRRIAKVTLYEVDSAALLQRRPAAVQASSAGEDKNVPMEMISSVSDNYDWVWPVGMPHVDGVMLCYDVSDTRSTEGLDDLCVAFQAREIPALAVECKKDLVEPLSGVTTQLSTNPAVSADLMSVRMRRFGMGLVETSVRTEAGKRTARAAFKWVIRSILRGWGQGSNRVAGQKWRNPASPEVLRALPWELGDGDVFISSGPSRAASPPPHPTPQQLAPAWTDVRDPNAASASMSRSASSPSSTSTSPTPRKLSVDTPAYLLAKPSALPSVFVRDSPEYARSQAEINKVLGPARTDRPPGSKANRLSVVNATASPTSPTRRRTLRQSSSQTTAASSSLASSALKKATAEPRASLSGEGTDLATSSLATPTSSSASTRRGSLIPPPPPPVPSNGGSPSILAPSRAKSTPEFAYRVRFQLSDDVTPVPSVLVDSPARVRSGSNSSIIPSLISAITSSPSRNATGPPSSYAPSGHRSNNNWKTNSSGPPTLPPLDIPNTASFASAAEDIISSATASAKYREEEEEREQRRRLSVSTSSRPVQDEASPQPASSVAAPSQKSSKRKLRTMDSAALIEYEIARNEKKKNPHGNKPVLVTLNQLLNELVNSTVWTVQTPFIDTFLISMRVYSTPQEVIDGLHRRMRVMEKKVKYPPTLYTMQFGVCKFILRWITEHPTDFGSEPANEEIMRLLTWMRTRTYLLYYVTLITPLARACVQLDQDPDCMYAKKDPHAKAWEEIDDALTSKANEEANDSDLTETESMHRSPISGVNDKGKGKQSSNTAILFSRTARREKKRFEDAALLERFIEHEQTADPLPSSQVSLINRSKKKKDLKIAAHSPIGPIKDNALEMATEERRILLLTRSLTESNAEEQAAAKRLGHLRYMIRMVQQPVLDAIRLRSPPVFDYAPLAIEDQTTRREIVENLQKAASVLLLMEPRHVAEEMTNLVRPSFLRIQPRDWIRHARKPKPKIIDDEEGYEPPRLPAWIPAHDDIDEVNDMFNRWVVWTTSLIVAPDAFADRQRVVLHLIKVAQELRHLNNYFVSHALQIGIRPTIFPGDLITQLVEKDRLFKVFLSLEILYADASSHKAYRLGFTHTKGPAIPDLSVHVVDFTRWQAAPDLAVDGSGKINWGKWSKICGDHILELGKMQRNFHLLDTHDFIKRPKIRKVLMTMPLMPDAILHPRTTPIDPRDGAEHPNREKMKRFLGIKPIGPAFNPAATNLPPQLPPGFYDPENRFPLK